MYLEKLIAIFSYNCYNELKFDKITSDKLL